MQAYASGRIELARVDTRNGKGVRYAPGFRVVKKQITQGNLFSYNTESIGRFLGCVTEKGQVKSSGGVHSGISHGTLAKCGARRANSSSLHPCRTSAARSAISDGEGRRWSIRAESFTTLQGRPTSMTFGAVRGCRMGCCRRIFSICCCTLYIVPYPYSRSAGRASVERNNRHPNPPIRSSTAKGRHAPSFKGGLDETGRGKTSPAEGSTDGNEQHVTLSPSGTPCVGPTDQGKPRRTPTRPNPNGRQLF